MKNIKTSKFNYFILFIIPILFFVMENFTMDNDFWFTIAEGKYVLKKGFPHTVPFTIYNNLDFIYQSWGTGVIFYLIHKYFGLYGMLFFVIIILIIITYFYYKLCMLVSNKNLINMIRNNPTKTHIFEYISLKDAHIVRYDKSQEGLYLIGLVDNYTGRESSYKDIIDYANKYNVLTTCVYDKNIHIILDELNNKQSDEAEGFVINIDGEKFKLKYNDYVKMHRVLSAISSPNLTIEMIADDKFDDYISKVPFMYREQIFEIANNVFKYIDNVNEYVNLCYTSIPNYILENRGRACKYITDTFDNKYNCFIIRKYLDKPYNVLKNKNNSILNYTQILNKNEYVSNLLNETKDKEVIHEL